MVSMSAYRPLGIGNYQIPLLLGPVHDMIRARVTFQTG